MPIVRKLLAPDEVYPSTIRYNPDTDTVQTDVNGTFVDSPEADPRHQTTLPPRITSNTACDAAESVKDAFKGQIDGILTAIDNGQTAFTIAGLVLGLFTFGVFDIFVAIALAIANAMLDAGTASLDAALTDPVYHQLACILFCNMDSQGRLTADSLATVMSDVTDQVGGLAAVTLNSMLALAGEGGVNNLAALGMSTGDCSDCECAWCYTFDFETTDGGFTGASESLGEYVPTVGWRTTFSVLGDGNGYRILQLQKAFTAEITSITVSVDLAVQGTPPYPSNWVYVTSSVGVVISSGATPGTSQNYQFDWAGDQSVTGLTYIQVSAGFGPGGIDPGGEAVLKTITLMGKGDNPFGDDNC